MKNIQKYILMYKDYEVLSFELNLDNHRIKNLVKLEHFDKAPYVIIKEENDITLALLRFFNSRLIPKERFNHKEILKATGCKSSFELSFKGHGLSLSNHYWYKKEGENLKYEDINFFTNKWDDSFARALLKEDYEALKKCDLNVPDIVTPGWSAKGWLYEDGPKLYKLGIVKGHYEDCLGEVLASRLAQRLLNEGEVVKYELKQINGQYASVSSLMIGIDEELVPLSRVLPPKLYDIYSEKNKDRKKIAEFFKGVADFGMPELYEFFAKLQCIRSLCFVNDLHFENISVIRNNKTGKIRVAPLYDLAGAFGSSQFGRDFISKLDKGSYFILYYVYGGLDPNWDYSWYDPNKLIGFEDDIKEVLSKSEFYTPDLIERIIAVYHQQKSSLDELSRKNTK